MIKNSIGVTPIMTHGKTGQFEVRADGYKVVERGGNWFTRLFGAGYPDLNRVVALVQERKRKAF